LSDPEIVPEGNMKLRYRTYIPYKTVAQALKKGNDVRFSVLKRQTAHQAAKKLSKLVG